jgi:hypothetical protein
LSPFRPGLDGQFGTRELLRLVLLLTSFHEDILPDLPVVTAIIEYVLARSSEKCLHDDLRLKTICFMQA